jgi:hypothetical protein
MAASTEQLFDLLVKFAEEDIWERFPMPEAEITELATKAVQAYVNDSVRAQCWSKAIDDVMPPDVPSED